MAPLFRALLAAAALAVQCLAKPDITSFKNLPSRLYYFEDTSVVLYHDPVSRNVHISENEGKSWKPVPNVPEGEALMLIEHPSDSNMAFILTNHKKHYRTKDRGRAWQSFELPIDAAFTRAPLSFHADKKYSNHILYQGTKCTNNFPWWQSCEDQTYYTKDGFETNHLLLSDTSQCSWAKSTKGSLENSKTHDELIFCIAFDTSSDDKSSDNTIASSRMWSSSSYFDKSDNSKQLVEFGGSAKLSRGVVALGLVSKFMTVALKDLSHNGNSNEMLLYVSTDGATWAPAKFPHASSSRLLENAYTIVESTTHSIAVDVLTHSKAAVGTLFVSNSNGTEFVESLQNTNRNRAGFVDFEDVIGVEGVGIANVVANANAVEGQGAAKRVKSVITFDDGRSWKPIPAPDRGATHCTPDASSDDPKCTLHFYSVTTPHNFGRVFSSPAPGFIFGVGSIGDHLLPYDECDTFLSTDAGVSWRKVADDAHKYEVGDVGSVMVLVQDEEAVDFIRYSIDEGQTWTKYDLGIKMRARILTTIPDSTSQKFLLVGTLSRQDATKDYGGNRHVLIHLDFASIKPRRKCEKSDMEKWYARTIEGKECLMGHKQWYNRRKKGADCAVEDEFDEPTEHEDVCECEDSDYECDYNFVRQGGKCVAAGPEPIEAGVCPGKGPDEKYLGSSGYRLIPGNTCKGGVKLDEKVQKDCSLAAPPEGNVTHQSFEFNSPVQGHWYFKDSKTILVHLTDGEVWQSSNEGYSWGKVSHDGDKILAVYMHSFSNERAYLFTQERFYYTTDSGKLWSPVPLPNPPNLMGIQLLQTHPLRSDWLIYMGQEGCSPDRGQCHAVAYYSLDHGRNWYKLEEYVRTCSWARDSDLKIDEELVMCESYRDKKGSQLAFGGNNPLELWLGGRFYADRKKLFDNVVGHTKFSEYLIVGELTPKALELEVSLDGRHYAKGHFPPGMQVNNHAYTVLESSTDSVFLHLTMSSQRHAEWGNILKSNSNGTYYGLSLEYANRNEFGYVDFEKMIGLDGIAVVNILANPESAAVSGKKDLQSRITRNDGGTWSKLNPPPRDSLGQPYKCTGVKCSLHIHGFTERIDARATYSSPSAIGLMMAVGNVGEKLAPYEDSDTFLTRDGGFTWEEIRKDAHMYEFGDSGSVLVIANDERMTSEVLYSTDEGTNWKSYDFGTKIRVRSIVTVTTETSRKFIVFGVGANRKAIAVHLDFSALTHRQCELRVDNSGNDDFELWSPSEEREERCLFGRQVLYHRRIRDRNCYVGDQRKDEMKLVKHCACLASDFECEFNHVRNSAGECVLTEGAQALTLDTSETCIADPDSENWYERTAYRKIPFSTCEGGVRLDQGPAHSCGGLRGHSGLFWWSVVIIPFAIAGVVGWWFVRKGQYAKRRGAIRLPDASSRNGDTLDPIMSRYDSDSGVLSTIASVPYFLLGVGASAYAWVSNHRLFSGVGRRSGVSGGYRHVPVDEDARVLRFEDEED